jgi:uncharacterized protein
MVELGKINTMSILRDTSVGMFLGGPDFEDILLPNRYVPIDKRIGDEMDVFVYLDSEDRPVATTDLPLVMRDEYASLLVKDVNRIGAFLDWGLEKDLLLPFREQTKRLDPNDYVFVKVGLDEVTNRLFATMKWKKNLTEEEPHYYSGEPVEAIIASVTEMGYNAIVDLKYNGLLYQNEVFKTLRVGDHVKAHVKKVREDGKIDLQLEAGGAAGIEPNAQFILDLIEKNGEVALNDKSSPDDIKRIAHMSKKAFKKAVGSLYKQRLIEFTETGIRKVSTKATNE